MPELPNQISRWREKIYLELAPTHGRFGGALRTAFAVVLAAYFLLVLQTPLIAPGLYLIFLVSYDVPYLTFQRSVMELTTQCVGVALTLALIIVTGNDPMARVLGVAAFTFLSAFLLCACTRRVAAMNMGIFPILTLSLWEFHLPPEQLVHLSMWPIATGALAVGCKVVIEYMFTRRDPHHALQREMEARIEALEQLFLRYAEGAPASQMKRNISTVSRYALSGQAKMLALLQEVENHPAREVPRFTISPTLIPAIVRLLDLGAVFARRHRFPIESDVRPQAARIAEALAAIQAERIDDIENLVESEQEASASVLGRIEQLLYTIGEMTHADHALSRERLLDALPQKQKVPWLRRDAWSNPEYLTYATKLSLSATICYIIYNALAWPGISTATLTVLVVGLSTSGATNQKMIFRIIGATIGGIIFGIGCIIFVYPFADTAMPFLISLGLVSFIGAWIARSTHLGYVGLQIIFSFLLVAFQEYAGPQTAGGGKGVLSSAVHAFGAPMQMTPARDRVLGVFLALFVMWAVFHRLHPKRTVDKMREGLARLLRVHADLLSRLHGAKAGQIAALRQDADGIAVEVRSLAEAIPYELDQHVERDLEISERIQNAMASAGSVLLHAVTALPEASETPAQILAVKSIHDSIAQGLRNLSAALEGTESKHELERVSSALSMAAAGASSSPCLRHALSAFSKLQEQCLELEAAPE